MHPLFSKKLKKEKLKRSFTLASVAALAAVTSYKVKGGSDDNDVPINVSSDATGVKVKVGSDDKDIQLNVHNEPLQLCGTDPMTGFHRSGYCSVDPNDFGTHTVCAKVTKEFLERTKKAGNDLSTP